MNIYEEIKFHREHAAKLPSGQTVIPWPRDQLYTWCIFLSVGWTLFVFTVGTFVGIWMGA